MPCVCEEIKRGREPLGSWPRVCFACACVLQDLGDLDRVGRGALEQVVGDDPHVERAGVGQVLADAADEGVVLPAALTASG